MDILTNIAHVAFHVKDMEKSIEFYCGALGLTKAFELHDDAGKPWIVYLKVCDRQFIELFHNGVGQAQPMTKQAGYHHFCLGVDDIAAFAESLHRKGLFLDKKPTQGKDTNYQMWIKDPDGVDIELMQLSPQSPQSLS
jgi:catechol 2,3-dioxygenase-like lactoylglutathione lyase family enzyme